MTAGHATRAATRAAVAVALTLMALKLWAWRATGSTAMLGSLMDSSLDAVASMATFIAVRRAAAPPDVRHRFGHGKAEILAALFQVFLVTLAALVVIAESVRRFLYLAPVERHAVGLSVAVFSMVATGALVAYQISAVRKSGSLAVRADSIHYAGDFGLNAVVASSFVVALFAPLAVASRVDAGLGALVALWLLWGARGILSAALDQFMDRELPHEVRENIKRAILAHPEARGVHDLRTRASGVDRFVQAHVEMNPTMTLYDAHKVADEVEEAIIAVLPGATVIIHQDPEGYETVRPLEAS